MEIMKKAFRRITFKAKILFLIYAVSAIPTLFLIGILYQNMVGSYEEKNLRDISQGFRQQTALLDERIEKAISITTEMATNKLLNDFFLLNVSDPASDILEYNKTIEPVISWLQLTRPEELGAVRFYTSNNTLFSNKFILPLEPYCAKDPQLLAAVEALESGPISLQYYPENRFFYGVLLSPGNSLSIFTRLSGSPTYRTYLETELQFNSIYQLLSTGTSKFEGMNYLLVRDGGQALFSSDADFFGLLARDMQWNSGNHAQENVRVSQNGKDYVINSAPIPGIESTLVCCTDFHAVSAPIERTRLAFLLISFSCVALFCAAANLLVDRLLQRLSVIDHNIHKIQEGNFDINIKVTGNDTIDKVAGSLNTMALRIRQLIEDVYENQIQLKNLQIKMLSQQISPHFLYNTLECLKMRAELDDQKEIAVGITALGKLLRYYANIGAEFSSVEKELSSVRDYVALMNLVGKNRCRLRLHTDESLLRQTMPNFVLQPLIENCMKHGGARNSCVEVTIQICAEGDVLCFAVADNGLGIQPERLAEIRRRLEAHNKPPNQWEEASAKFQAGSESIGIYNTHDRIKLICGYEYGLSVDSVPLEGTTVRFSIPIYKEEA